METLQPSFLLKHPQLSNLVPTTKRSYCLIRIACDQTEPPGGLSSLSITDLISTGTSRLLNPGTGRFNLIELHILTFVHYLLLSLHSSLSSCAIGPWTDWGSCPGPRLFIFWVRIWFGLTCIFFPFYSTGVEVPIFIFHLKLRFIFLTRMDTDDVHSGKNIIFRSVQKSIWDAEPVVLAQVFNLIICFILWSNIVDRRKGIAFTTKWGFSSLQRNRSISVFLNQGLEFGLAISVLIFTQCLKVIHQPLRFQTASWHIIAELVFVCNPQFSHYRLASSSQLREDICIGVQIRSSLLLFILCLQF